MKTIQQKKFRAFCLFSMLFSLFSAFAQAPQKMSYQGIVRNAGNVLIANANVGMRISVLQGAANGTAVYVETQTATTNANGLVTLEIGAGTVVSGTFASISWGTNSYFIKTETDPTGGTNYTIVGTSQFLSVPYALSAANAPNFWTKTGADIFNNNSGNVGIGNPSPAEKLDVNGNTKTLGIQMTTGAGNGKVLTSDATGFASWQTAATVNQSVETTVFNLATGIQNVQVDFPTTNVIVPATGTYLVTYFVDAYNTFILECIDNCTNPRVDQTIAYICNKSDGNIYQKQNVDFRSVDRVQYPTYSSVTYRLPSHQVSGSIVRSLVANQQIGIKMESLGSPSTVSEVRIRNSTVTLIRLF